MSNNAANKVEFLGSTDKSNMRVRVVKEGTVEIGAKIDGNKANQNYVINVIRPKVSITNFPTNGISGKNIYILKDNTTHQLGVSITPQPPASYGVYYEWSPATSNIATVDETGKITTKAEGITQVTVRAYKSGRLLSSDTFALRVVHIDSVFIDGLPQYDLTVGESYDLTAQVYPYYSFTQEVTWSLAANSIVNSNQYASITANGKLTLKDDGIITVYARSKIDNTVYFPLEIVIHPKATGITITNLPENNTLWIGSKQTSLNSSQLNPTFSPSGALPQTVDWISSDRAIVDIDDSGRIVAKNIGEANISCYTKDKKISSDPVKITVKLYTGTASLYIFSNSKNFNCYAYALNETQWRNVGGPNFRPSSLDVDYIAEQVLKDVEELGRTIRIIDSYDSPIYSNEYRIALRTGSSDYHFMLQLNNGTWAHKPASFPTRIEDGYNPTLFSWNKPLHNENILQETGKLVEVGYTENYYNSKTIYFSISKE